MEKKSTKFFQIKIHIEMSCIVKNIKSLSLKLHTSGELVKNHTYFISFPATTRMNTVSVCTPYAISVKIKFDSQQRL